MVVLCVATGKTSGHFYDWKHNNTANIKWSAIELAFYEIERQYSSKLTKKLKSLIMDSLEHETADQTNLSDSLKEFDEMYSRVQSRIKKTVYKY